MNDNGAPPLSPDGTPQQHPYGAPQQNPYGTPQQNPYYTPYVKPIRIPYNFVPGDAGFACFTLALGFICWELNLFSNFGTFLILMTAIIGSGLYLHSRGVRQTSRSIAVLAVCVFSVVPFLLYDSFVPVYFFLLVLALVACFYWITVSTGNSVEDRVSGFVLTDWLNQTFSVPFSNFLALLISIKTASKDTKRGKSVLIGAIGLCIAIPLIIGVTSLLIDSDKGFEKFANDFSEWIGLDDIGSYLLKFIGGIPIAVYVFGAVIGMCKKDIRKASLKREPRRASLPPIVSLALLYSPLLPFS